MQLHLICHGMMLFWYNKPSVEGAGDDGYTILIPQMSAGPPKPGDHQLLLGRDYGALQPVLTYPMTPQGTQAFKLSFDAAPSDKIRSMKSNKENLVFYANDMTGARAVPTIGADYTAGIAVTIDIPYPRAEHPIRAARYFSDPYDYINSSSTIDAFDVHPRRIVNATVLTFDIVDGNKPILLVNKRIDTDQRLLDPGSITKPVVLHLYSQPAVNILTDHLHMLTGMLKYKGSELDLRIKKDVPSIKYPPLPIPEGLHVLDLLHLGELNELGIPTGAPMTDAEKRMTGTLGVDPAECGQGGGC